MCYKTYRLLLQKRSSTQYKNLSRKLKGSSGIYWPELTEIFISKKEWKRVSIKSVWWHHINLHAESGMFPSGHFLLCYVHGKKLPHQCSKLLAHQKFHLTFVRSMSSVCPSVCDRVTLRYRYIYIFIRQERSKYKQTKTAKWQQKKQAGRRQVRSLLTVGDIDVSCNA